MRLLKSHPILRWANSYLVDSPQPLNLSYMWNFGSLLTFCLIIQIIHYNSIIILDAIHYSVFTLIYFLDFNVISCDAPKGWMKFFGCFDDLNSSVDKTNIRLHSLDHASTGITRSPNLPRDTSNNNLGSLAVSLASRVVHVFWG